MVTFGYASSGSATNIRFRLTINGTTQSYAELDGSTAVATTDNYSNAMQSLSLVVQTTSNNTILTVRMVPVTEANSIDLSTAGGGVYAYFTIFRLQ
jgi:hypothetical protein